LCPLLTDRIYLNNYINVFQFLDPFWIKFINFYYTGMTFVFVATGGVVFDAIIRDQTAYKQKGKNMQT